LPRVLPPSILDFGVLDFGCFWNGPAIFAATAVKILLIDDDPGVVRGLSARLRREGYETLAAMDAVQAMIFARKEMPDLILLDLALPGGNGIRVLENLSRSSATAGIPVVILSGSSDSTKLALARELGAVDCFVKGADLDPLLSKIRELTGTGSEERRDGTRAPDVTPHAPPS
jgi:DNA-binding response OmpR family regulator